MDAIKTGGLTKRYGAKAAVDNLNLTVGEGELFALLGVNGAGKSTLIKMLCCLTPPTAGNAWLLGNSVRTQPQAVKQSINVSPQETAVAPGLTVRENLALIRRVYGGTPDEAAAHAQRSIEAFGMHEIANSRAKTLSGGWQRRLSLAMALISEPKILFLDEPTLGLDVLARRALWKTIEAIKGNATIILTTHYLEEAEALADRIGILVRGRLAAVGTAQELVAQAGAANFEDAFIALAGEGVCAP